MASLGSAPYPGSSLVSFPLKPEIAFYSPQLSLKPPTYFLALATPPYSSNTINFTSLCSYAVPDAKNPSKLYHRHNGSNSRSTYKTPPLQRDQENQTHEQKLEVDQSYDQNEDEPLTRDRLSAKFDGIV
ncbi:hypothetical protein L6164_007863 [Bauhinia variegata]|uniref:Uncharacterized protein n=1 Tax=Bauhinia variegata TaxID=167791 RepID=A0ACB9PHT9_BAUVA|nr:hypothetical protein L6164_007863 [Bauhinia variegata]